MLPSVNLAKLWTLASSYYTKNLVHSIQRAISSLSSVDH